MSRLAGGGLLLGLLVSSVLFVGCPTPPNTVEVLPEALFECRPCTGYLPLVVQFTDLSKSGSSPIREWVWDFGDGSKSFTRNPRHTYYKMGQYTVSLRVTTGVGTDSCLGIKYVTVAEPAMVVSMGPAGGRLDVEGARLIAPAGAFEDTVIVSGVPNEGSVVVRSGEGEVLVSDVFSIGHDQDDLYLDPRTPLTLSIPFIENMVPESGRNSTQLQILAMLDSGISVPILGEVSNGVVSASIAGLPHRASYGVVYRPQIQMLSMNVEEIAAKVPTSYRWRVDDWRLVYTDNRLQELTALRIGNLSNTSAYSRRDWTRTQLSQTLADVQLGVAEQHIMARDAGFISPMLLTSPEYAYTLIFHPLNASPVTDYESLSEVVFATSIFGDIVVDPVQLATISRRNASGAADERQEVEFRCAFAQALFRASFRGYDFPAYSSESSSDLDTELRPRDIRFTQGFEDGLAAYLGQWAAGIAWPRSLGPNEYSKISEPLFAPWSSSVAAYSYATQDFFFYVTQRFSPADPLSYISDSYEGVLDVIRVRSRNSGVTSYADAAVAAREATAISLERFFGVSLSDVYWQYARDRAYGNSANSLLRFSEKLRDANTLNEDEFSEDTLLTHKFTAENETFSVTFVQYPELATAPPLATRAIVLTPGTVEGELRLNADAYNWSPDEEGRSMKALVYRERMVTEGVYEPVGTPTELTAADAEISLDGFGSDLSTGFDRALVLISNVTYDRTYSFAITASLLAGAVEEPTGALSGLISDGVALAPLQGVSIAVRRVAGGIVGPVVATATTDTRGAFGITNLAAGNIEVTISRVNYVTKKITTVITAGQTTVLQVSLTPAT